MEWTRRPGIRWIGGAALLGLVMLAGWQIGLGAARQSSLDLVAPSAAPLVHRDIHAQVIRLSPQDNAVTLDHEAIPGFMGAMRMDLQVAQASDLAGLQPGDRVRFDLVHQGDTYVATGFRKVDDTVPAASATRPADGPRADALGRGDLLPDLALYDTQGKTFSLHGLPARHKVITFFYARCPHDQFCPAQARKLATLQTYLNAAGRDIHLVSLTLDAAHDGPQVLAGYAERFKIDPGRWTLAGGDDAQTLRDLADRLGARIHQHAIGHEIDHALIGVRVDGQRIVDLVYGLEAIERLVRGM